MGEQTVEGALQAANSPTEFVRTIEHGADPRHLRLFADLPDEYTNWRTEQMGWKEGCGLADLSHHMYDLRVEGPDALDLFKYLGANSFDNFEPGTAKQFIACNPDGHLIGDGILFYLAPDEFNLVGYSPINWVRYHVETGEYEASATVNEHGGVRSGPPREFRYQVQGPNALNVIREAIDGPVPEVPFFNFDEISIGGNPVYALRHGMMDEPGFEVFGPWEYAAAVREILLDVGQRHGIRRIGGKAYPTVNIPTAWIPIPVPAIYSEGMQDYREWLDAGTWEGALTVGGSYNPSTISDYYLDPVETGLGRFIDFDGDFVGRDALRERAERQLRTKVTLVWNSDDVTNIFGSLFEDTDAYKWAELPTPNWAVTMYDRVIDDAETVGISIAPRYLYFEKKMLSLGIVDTDRSEPGTRVTLVWGEEESSSNPRVEPHVQTEIDATVAPAPYTEDKRKTTDYSAV